MKNTNISLLNSLAALALVALSAGCGREAKRNAEAQVRRIAADLDARTTPTGSYVRAGEGEIKDVDPWGTPLKVTYTQGGVAENVEVRSAGPDRQLYSEDDVVAGHMAANFKGVGQGILQNADNVAGEAAKGAVKGAAAGVKEVAKEAASGVKAAAKEAWPFKKKKEGEPETKAGEQSREKPAP